MFLLWRKTSLTVDPQFDTFGDIYVGADLPVGPNGPQPIVFFLYNLGILSEIITHAIFL